MINGMNNIQMNNSDAKLAEKIHSVSVQPSYIAPIAMPSDRGSLSKLLFKRRILLGEFQDPN